MEVGNGTVSFRPDRVIEQPWDAVTVQSLRMRLPRRPGACEGIHALMLEGARDRFPGARITIETYDLDSGSADWPNTAMADDALDGYRQAIAGIERGDFAPRPDGRTCPQCQFFFVCGARGAALRTSTGRVRTPPVRQRCCWAADCQSLISASVLRATEKTSAKRPTCNMNCRSRFKLLKNMCPRQSPDEPLSGALALQPMVIPMRSPFEPACVHPL